MSGPGENQVQVWQVDVEAAACERLWPVLTEAERARARAFHFPDDRRRFTVARGVLRLLLGRCLDRDPAGVPLATGPHGKPHLAGHALHFNVAHSHGVALIALASDRRVGVDVERIRHDLDVLGLAARAFAPPEAAALRALPPRDRTGAFFACWARKEAYVKATGLGLSLPLDAFTVPLAPDAGWSVRDLAAAPGYAAAVAAEGHGWRLACRRWDG